MTMKIYQFVITKYKQKFRQSLDHFCVKENERKNKYSYNNININYYYSLSKWRTDVNSAHE